MVSMINISAIVLILALQTNKCVVLCKPFSVEISIENEIKSVIVTTSDDKTPLKVKNKLGNDKNCNCTNLKLCKPKKVAEETQGKSILSSLLSCSHYDEFDN